MTSRLTPDDVFYKCFRLTVFLERKSGITGVPFGRTELSLRLSGTQFRALLHRRGPEGPGAQGMREKSRLQGFPIKKNMEIVNEHGWISAVRAESDTK